MTIAAPATTNTFDLRKLQPYGKHGWMVWESGLLLKVWTIWQPLIFSKQRMRHCPRKSTKKLLQKLMNKPVQQPPPKSAESPKIHTWRLPSGGRIPRFYGWRKNFASQQIG